MTYPRFLPVGTPPDEPVPPFDNPYGNWDGRGGPPCRTTEPLYVCSLCGDHTTPDPTGLVLWWVIGTHMLPFVVVVFAMWCVIEKMDILRKRIYSPFLLLTGIVYCAIASMPEAASHIYAMNWNLCYDSAESGGILLFYIFLSAGFGGLTIGLRKKGCPLIRCPSGFWDIVSFLADWIIIILSLGIGPIYGIFGKAITIIIFIVVQSAAAIVGIPRIYYNLGPTKKMLFLGAFSELAAVIIAIPLNLYMQRTGEQWLHGLLATSFILNQLGIGLCILDIVDTSPDLSGGGGGESTPLVGSGEAESLKDYATVEST